MNGSLKIGDKIKDNDPRGPGNRILTIVELGRFKVRVESRAGNRTAVSRARIYSDGKPRRSGFDLVKST